MDKLEVFKAGLGLVVSVGVGAIAGNAVKAFSPSDVHAIKKVCVSVGGVAITSMVTKNVVDYVDGEVDELVARFKDGAAQLKAQKAND